MDSGFKFAPFGAGGQLHGDCFVTQGRHVREDEMGNLAARLERTYWQRDRRWIILFPEGNFLYKQKASNRKWAERQGHPITQHVLLPRVGALRTILARKGGSEQDSKSEATLPTVKYVLDMTIAYSDQNKSPGLVDLWLGLNPKPIKVLYKLIPIEKVPYTDSEATKDWLWKLWMEKDEMLKTYYETGVFAGGMKGLQLDFPSYNLVGQTGFWLGSLSLFYYTICLVIDAIGEVYNRALN